MNSSLDLSRLTLSEPFFRCGVSWDLNRKGTDLDLSGVVYDNAGFEISAVYYNELVTPDNLIQHSGDNRDGSGDGDDEIISINLGQLNEQITSIWFMINVRNGTFADVKTARLHLYSGLQQVHEYPLGCVYDQSAFLIGVVHRLVGGTWEFVKIEASGLGHNFQEARQIFQDHMHLVYPQEIIEMTRSHNLSQRYEMTKGDVYIISPEVKTVFLGLGWDAGRGIDIDASVSAYDVHMVHVTDVYFGHLNDQGMSHSGDNLTGEGSGDDERITLNLPRIPPHIHYLASIICIYSGAQGFRNVKNAYCRMVEPQKNRELCRFNLSQTTSNMCGMLMCVLSRHGMNNWKMEVRGEPLSERTVRNCHYEIQTLLSLAPQLRRVTTALPTPPPVTLAPFAPQQFASQQHPSQQFASQQFNLPPYLPPPVDGPPSQSSGPYSGPSQSSGCGCVLL